MVLLAQITKKFKKKLRGICLLAEELGVSTATISRALNPSTSHLVKESRRNQILELADRMRFRPNPGARLIQKGHNSTLGLLIPEQDDVFFSEFYGRLMGGLIRAVAKTGWEVRINTVVLGEKSVIEEFRRKGLGISGLIYAGFPLTNAQVDELAGFYSPLILLSSTLPPECPMENVKCHVLGVDNYTGAFKAARHILDLGHKRIGLILGPQTSRDFLDREHGYRDALAQAGIDWNENMVFRDSFEQDSGRAGCQFFMAKSEIPEAIICANDSIAFGVIDQVKESGLKCPGDISVIGFDDGPWAAACSPKLTTIRQPLGALTQHAVSLLKDAVMVSKTRQLERYFLKAELQVRDSTAPAKRRR